MQGRVKLPCMGYMRLLTPRSVVGRFVVVPTVTVSYCLFHGVLGFCVNVRIPLRLFSLMSPSAWRLSIVINGHASSDWSPGPMLMYVCLGDVCVVIGSSLMFLVFFCLCVDKKSWSYLFYHNIFDLQQHSQSIMTYSHAANDMASSITMVILFYLQSGPNSQFNIWKLHRVL